MFCTHAHLPSHPNPPPRHLWRHALTSAGISAPSSLSLMRFRLARRKPHRKFHVHYKSFSGGPRLPARPRLDCRDCCLAAPGSCGVGVRLTERGSGGCRSCLIKYMFPVLTCQARGPYCSRPRMKDSLRSTPSTRLMPRINNLQGVATRAGKR